MGDNTIICHSVIIIIIMSCFEGKFVLESSSNVAAGMAAIGMPEEDVKKFLDPNNVVSYDITEPSPDCFQVDSKVSLMPEWNSSACIKLGEIAEFTKPFPYTIVITKKGSNTLVNKNEMMGKTLISEQTFHNYGMTSVTTVEGSGVTFTEIFKRVTPKISGYFVFESESGLAGLMAALGMESFDVGQITTDMSFRMKDKGDCFEVTEYFGDKKIVCAKYNEEYDYERPEWKINDKRITTKVGPGMIKTICKDKKTGKTWEYNLCFQDKCVKINSKVGSVESHEVYKRMADTEGKWRPVSNVGAESYADALGVTGADKEKLVADTLKDWFTIERLAGGLVKMNSSSDLFGKEMIWKMGEEWSMEMPIFGKMTGIATEGCDSMANCVKMMGKTIGYKDIFSGDFLISEARVVGSNASPMISIYTRD